MIDKRTSILRGFSLSKAKPKKYFRREPNGRGSYNYFYTEGQWINHLKKVSGGSEEDYSEYGEQELANLLLVYKERVQSGKRDLQKLDSEIQYKREDLLRYKQNSYLKKQASIQSKEISKLQKRRKKLINMINSTVKDIDTIQSIYNSTKGRLLNRGDD